MEYVNQTMVVREIDRNDSRFLHRFVIEPVERRTATIIPPVVVRRADKYILVSGFRRVHAFDTNDDKINVLVPKDDLTDKELFILSLRLNEGSVLSDLDRAVVVVKALDEFGLSREEAVEHLATLCGVDRSWKMIQRYYDCGLLEDEVKEYCHTHGLGIKFALALRMCTAEGRAFVMKHVLTRAFFTESEMTHLIEMARELNSIKQCGLRDIFDDTSIKAALENEGYTPKERARAVIAQVSALRFPTITALEGRIREIKHSLAGNKNIAFAVPDNFERPYSEITIKFRSRDELEKALNDLQERIDVFDKTE